MTIFEDFDKTMAKANKCEKASNISFIVAVTALTCMLVFDRVDKKCEKHCKELFPGD